MKKLDENELFHSNDNGYLIPGASLEELIPALIEETATPVILDAPVSLLSDSKDSDVTAEWENPGAGYVEPPKDFLRITSFKMSDWTRSISNAVEYGSMEYDLRFHPHKSRRVIRKSPAISIRTGCKRKYLEFTGSSDPAAFVERLNYVPIPSISEQGFVHIPSGLVPKITDLLAQRIKRIQQRDS